MSRRSWSPTATAASSPRKQRRESRPCAMCCSCPATCPRSGRASPRSAARSPPRSSTSIPRAARSASARSPGRYVPAGLRSGDPATGRGQDGPAEPGGHRAAGAGGRMAAGGLDVPRLRRGPGHPAAAARVRPPGRQRRGARRRSPPVPVPAGRRPGPGAEPVTAPPGACANHPLGWYRSRRHDRPPVGRRRRVRRRAPTVARKPRRTEGPALCRGLSVDVDPVGRHRGYDGDRNLAISVVPANEASWEDLQAVFGTRGAAPRCQCQRYKLRPREAFRSFPAEERAHRLREQTDCGHPESEHDQRPGRLPRRRARRLVRGRAAHRLRGPGAQQPRPVGGPRRRTRPTTASGR